MPASNTTIQQIINELNVWRIEHNVPKKAISNLLTTISKIPGNKSFTQTVNTLKKEFDNAR